MAEIDPLSERHLPSTAGLVFLGICVPLATIINGINYTSQNVVLIEIAHSLKVKEEDLQWVSDSYLLAFVSFSYQWNAMNAQQCLH